MANEFMWADIANVHQLANQTGAIAGEMAGTTSNLNSQLDGGLRPNWIGVGSGKWSEGQDLWTVHASRYVIHTLDSKSNDIRSGANLMDNEDMSAAQVMGSTSTHGGVGAAINPMTA